LSSDEKSRFYSFLKEREHLCFKFKVTDAKAGNAFRKIKLKTASELKR